MSPRRKEKGSNVEYHEKEWQPDRISPKSACATDGNNAGFKGSVLARPPATHENRDREYEGQQEDNACQKRRRPNLDVWVDFGHGKL